MGRWIINTTSIALAVLLWLSSIALAHPSEEASGYGFEERLMLLSGPYYTDNETGYYRIYDIIKGSVTKQLGFGNLNFYGYLWAGDLSNRFDADVVLSYLEYRTKTLSLRLGRQIESNSVRMETFDGLSVTLDRDRYYIALRGGIIDRSVEYQYGNNILIGATAGILFAPSKVFNIGFERSFTQDNILREEAWVDGRYRFFDDIFVSGLLVSDTFRGQIEEGRLSGSIERSDWRLEMFGDYSRPSSKLPNDSVLSVFGMNELAEGGVEVSTGYNTPVVVKADYSIRRYYHDQADGYEAGFSVTLNKRYGPFDYPNFKLKRLKEPDNGYIALLISTKLITLFDLSTYLNLEYYNFDQTIFQKTDSRTARITINKRILKRFYINGFLEYTDGGIERDSLSIMASITYRLDSRESAR